MRKKGKMTYYPSVLEIFMGVFKIAIIKEPVLLLAIIASVDLRP